MDKVKIAFYEDYGNRTIKTVHNVIPTSITMRARTDLYGKKELYLSYDIVDVIKHHGCYTLSTGIIFSIFPEDKEI